MRIAVTHPGGVELLLFALPTVRALSLRHQTNVDLFLGPTCRPAAELIAHQPGVGHVSIVDTYVAEHSLWGVQPWLVPIPESDYEATYHLGLRDYPDCHCMTYAARLAGVPDPPADAFVISALDTGVVRRLGLTPPWIVLTGAARLSGGDLAWEWANQKVSDFVEAHEGPIYAVGPEQEWRRFRCHARLTGLPGLSVAEIADVMKGASAVITSSTELGVLASGVLGGTDGRLVCLYDGEVPWDLVSLPGAVTCSPDDDLAALALGGQPRMELEQKAANLERTRRSQKRLLADASARLTVIPRMESTIAAQARTVAEQEDTIAAQARDAEAMQRHVESLEASLRERLAEKTSLEAAVAGYKAGRHAMEQSLSWKLTRPLRWLHQRVMGVRSS